MSYSQDFSHNAPEIAAKLKLLSNPNRLLIVCRLLEGEMSVGDIETELNIRQPTLSRELGHLRDAKVISPRRQSKVVFYSLTDPSMRILMEAICDVSKGRTRNKPVNSHAAIGANAIAFNPRPKFTNTGQALQGKRNDNAASSLQRKEPNYGL